MESRAEKLTPETVVGPLEGARILVVEEDFFVAIAVAVLDFRIGEETNDGRGAASGGPPRTFRFYTGLTSDESLRAKWPDCKVVLKLARPQVLINAIAALLRRNETRE